MVEVGSTFWGGSRGTLVSASGFASLTNGIATYEHSHPVLATVARRKMTEKEVEALENRIKRLELEEAKAKKGVAQVREKNQFVHQTQARAKRIAEERAQHERARRAEAERLREAAQKRKEQQRQNLQRAFTGMYSERLGEVRQLREDHERILEEAARTRERERTKSFGKHDQIRNRRKEVSSRFEMQRIAHQVRAQRARARGCTVPARAATPRRLPAQLLGARALFCRRALTREAATVPARPPSAAQEYLMQDFINLIQSELEQTDEIERDIARLDQLEADHVERIRQLQEEQRAAYDRLEQALGT